MKTATVTKSVLALVAAVAIGASGAVMADEADELKGRSEKIAFEDLNVEKESGAHALYRRLQHASKRVCGVEMAKKTRSAGARSDAYRCFRKELTAAVRKVDNELVTRIHEGN